MEDIKLNNKPKSKKPFSKHKILWGLGAGLGATLLTAAIVTPIVVYPGFKPAVDPTVDFEQGSSTDVSVKSKNIALNKESTITLNIAPGKELDTNPDSIKVSVGNVKLVRSLQYDVNYETKVITIKAEAMSSIHVQLKVVTKNIAYGFNVNLGAGITSWSSSTLSPKYHEKVVIECNVYNGYVFDQRILNTDASKGIQIKVGNRTLTSTNDVVVDADKSTITINEGVIDGDVSITGDIQLYEVSFSCDDHFKSVIEDSVASYQYIKDFVYPFELKDGCIDPSVSISSWNDKSETNTLDDGADFNLVKQLSDKRRYNYHLNFTESGRKKIIGPVSVYFSASKADEIYFDNVNENAYSFALGTTSPIAFDAHYKDGSGVIQDAEVYANCGTTGYRFDETSKTLIPGANVKEGQIQLTAIHDNVYKDLTVNVVKPSVKFEIKDTEWEQKVLSKSELEETHKYSISSTITPEIPGEDVTYEWSSSDDTKIKVEGTTKDADIEALSYSDNKAVTLTLKVKLNGNEITSKSIDLKVIKQLFEHTSWTQIVQYINEFESSGQDEEAQKTLCSYFSDTPYIKDISSEITDPDKQIEAHLASFINKEHEISYDTDITDNVRIIGINHDTIADGSNKKATFTFEAKHLVSSSASGGKALKSVWDAEKNSDYTNSVLNWNLNGTGNPAAHATKWSNPLINLIDIKDNIKKVTKQVAKYDTAGKAWNVSNYDAQLFPLSVAEMGINDTVHAKVEGSAYKFWKDVAKPADWIKTPKVIDDSDQDHYDCHYWLVSPSIDPDYDYISWLVNDGGIADYSKPSTFPGNKGIGVSFAFCI